MMQDRIVVVIIMEIQNIFIFLHVMFPLRFIRV